MTKYRLIIFDFDGTLVDTAPDIALHANDVLRSFGLPTHTIEAVKKAVGKGVHELFRDLSPALNEDETALENAVALFKENYWARPVVHTKTYPAVREMLSGPLASFKKAIVTNKPHDLAKKILEELSLSGYFEVVIGLDSDYPAKPDPSSVKHVMDFLKTSPKETLYIGDSHVDSQTCQNAGIDFGWASYGYDNLNGTPRAMEFQHADQWTKLTGQ